MTWINCLSCFHCYCFYFRNNFVTSKFQSNLVSKCKYFNLIQENSIKPELQYHKMKILFQYLLLRSCQLRIVLLKSRILIYLDFMIPVPINYVYTNIH